MQHKADVGLGFDGDGDRCGVVDNEGHEIFADKVGVMLARDISASSQGREVRRRREIDRPVHDRPGAAGQRRHDAYWKTGHSYMKRYSHETKALVGFEKSGHFFFNPPLGRGYDDGLVAAHRRAATCSTATRGKTHGRPAARAAQDLAVADHVAALRRRDEVRRRRQDGRALQGSARPRARRSPARRSAS